MTKEQKIDMLLAFLAPIIFEGKGEDTESAPQITFLSATEVQIEEFPGKQLPVNKEYPDNPLKESLEKIVNYDHADERKNWEESCAEELEDENINLESTYIPTLCPDHIYHTIYQLQELIEDCKQTESSSNNIAVSHKRFNSKLYSKIQDEANLGYKYLLVYRNKEEMEKVFSGKIYAICDIDGTFLCNLLENDFLKLQDDLTILDSLSMPEDVHYCTDWVIRNEDERRKVFSQRLVVHFTDDLN